METYTFLRELADSWVLLAMTLFFLGAVLWTFRPSARDVHRDTASIPLRNEKLESEECDGCGDCGGDCKSYKFEATS